MVKPVSDMKLIIVVLMTDSELVFRTKYLELNKIMRLVVITKGHPNRMWGRFRIKRYHRRLVTAHYTYVYTTLPPTFGAFVGRPRTYNVIHHICVFRETCPSDVVLDENIL